MIDSEIMGWYIMEESILTCCSRQDAVLNAYTNTQSQWSHYCVIVGLMSAEGRLVFKYVKTRQRSKKHTYCCRRHHVPISSPWAAFTFQTVKWQCPSSINTVTHLDFWYRMCKIINFAVAQWHLNVKSSTTSRIPIKYICCFSWVWWKIPMKWGLN